jgi:hypothetical protein
MAVREQQNLAGHILALAEQHPDPERLCVAHRICGATNEMMGELPAAREHLEQAIVLYDPERHGSTAHRAALAGRRTASIARAVPDNSA